MEHIAIINYFKDYLLFLNLVFLTPKKTDTLIDFIGRPVLERWQFCIEAQVVWGKNIFPLGLF